MRDEEAGRMSAAGAEGMEMEMERVVVAGGGGHAKVVVDVLRAAGWEVVGYTDPEGRPGDRIAGVERLGGDEALAGVRAAGVRWAIVALGDNGLRLRVAERMAALGFELATAVHPSAQVSPSARLGRGVVVMPGAIVNADSTIGDQAIVNTAASIDHDCHLGRGVHVAPGTRLAGYVTVEDEVLIGVGSVVGRGRPLTLGRGAIVGIGSAVVEDVPAGTTVVGRPARPLPAPAVSTATDDGPIPVAAPALLGNESRYVAQCVDSTWISSIGEFIGRFEHAVAERTGARHAASCANGTVALHLALMGIGIGPGDEVLVPSLTYVATVNAVRYCGAEPVFVDSDISTWNLDPEDLRRKITPRSRAVIPVHLYGRPAAMDEITAIARAAGLRVVEDAAEAIGALYCGRPAGSLGDIGAFSFFGNKIVSCGEGGMVTTDDDALAARMRQLKGQGQDPQRRYWFPIVGYNYRMTNIQAALGLAQMERIDHYLAARDEIAAWYRTGLAELTDAGDVVPAGEAPGDRNVCWLWSVVLPHHPGAQRAEVMARLAQSGIETRPFFYPCHTLPPYVSLPSAAACPRAEWLGERGLSLPTWVGMTRRHVERVCDGLARALVEVPCAAAPA